jgi:hypothetical protein
MMLRGVSQQPEKLKVGDVLLDDRRGDVRNAAERADLGGVDRRTKPPRWSDGTSNGLLRPPVGMHQRK